MVRKVGRGYEMDVIIRPNEGIVSHYAVKQVVEYTCPKCGFRNTHAWFGREVHYCNSCEELTDVKGSSFEDLN